MRGSNGFTAVKTVIFVKGKILSAEVKYFFDITRNGITNRMRMIFIKMLPVVIVLKYMFDSNRAGN